MNLVITLIVVNEISDVIIFLLCVDVYSVTSHVHTVSHHIHETAAAVSNVVGMIGTFNSACLK